jgi:hypothetical protein
MKRSPIALLLTALMALAAVGPVAAADPKTPALVCVSLMSETGEGYLSFRVGQGAWTPVKVGDTIPANGELQVTVDRDWAEFTPEKDPSTVYLLEGTDKGSVAVKVADLVKTASRKVAFPKAGKDTDPAFKDKLVVKQVTGRQVYRANADTPDKNIRYGDVLDIKGSVRIIGINNPLVLVFPNGAVTQVIGPLKFEVKKVFEGTSLYKYLNVTK